MVAPEDGATVISLPSTSSGTFVGGAVVVVVDVAGAPATSVVEVVVVAIEVVAGTTRGGTVRIVPMVTTVVVD